MSRLLVLAQLLDLGRHWEQGLLWLMMCVCGGRCSSAGTAWPLDTVTALRNVCLGNRGQALLLWEEVCEDGISHDAPGRSPPPQTRQPGHCA